MSSFFVQKMLIKMTQELNGQQDFENRWCLLSQLEKGDGTETGTARIKFTRALTDNRVSNEMGLKAKNDW